MNKHIHTIGSATIAISAMLALGSTPLAAQTAPAEPAQGAAATAPPPASAPIAGPVEGNAPVGTPTIVADPLPVAPVPVAEQPVTNEITASDPASIPAAAAPRETSTQRTEPRSAAAPAQRAAPDAAPAVLADAPTAETDTMAGAEESAQLELNAMPSAVPVEPEVLAQPADQSEEAILGGLLAALGLGAIGWAAVALRRRNRRAAKLRPAPAAKAPPTEPLSATTGPSAIAASVAPATPSDIREWMRPNAVVRGGESVSNEGAAVALPASAPGTFAERDALLRRMIEARPDRANPFRGVKARTKRARLILQSLGHRFKQRRSWIDLSQYPNNWPELRRDYAAAA